MTPSSSNHPDGRRSVDVPAHAIERSLQHPLLRSLVPTGMGLSPQACKQTFESEHGIDELILIYCARGQGWCEMEGRTHPVRAGDVLIVPPRAPHRCGPDPEDPWSIPWIQVTGENVQPLLTQLGVTTQAPVMAVGDDPRILALFDDAVSQVEDTVSYNTTTLFHTSQTVGHLLAVILRSQRAYSGKPLDPKERISRCLDYMRQHLDEPLHLDRLARVANLSPSHFSATFQKETGHAPMEYFVRLRLERAADLLTSTNCSVKEVALQLKYTDPANFCRAFRKLFGTTPSEYQEQARKKRE
jgi:AraC family transcriptional regulator of arabinose operon